MSGYSVTLPQVEQDYSKQNIARIVRDIEQAFQQLQRNGNLIGAVKATLDFGSIAANSHADLPVTVTGAKSGDTVIVTPPSTIEAGLAWCGFVSANDTASVRLHTYGTAAVDPASAEWAVTVVRYLK